MNILKIFLNVFLLSKFCLFFPATSSMKKQKKAKLYEISVMSQLTQKLHLNLVSEQNQKQNVSILIMQTCV